MWRKERHDCRKGLPAGLWFHHDLGSTLGASSVGGWIMRLERKLRTPLPSFWPLPQFSKRKNEVPQWMVAGRRNAEIARILCISLRTVKRHVAGILAALRVENRAAAILTAMEFCARENAV